ncbi:MAG: acyl-CoA carboxylase subunit beta, partial [Pseudomonadales bacterium]|nr:acyl-CoA carboxylase subunit beta [Pseudomonadales bacterium]
MSVAGSVFQSKIDNKSEAFGKNRAAMLDLVDRLHALNTRGELISESRKARFEKRGQLTP